MSDKTFTLDSIRAKAEAKYVHFSVSVDENTTVILRNVLRLSEDERKELSADREDEESTLESLRRTVRVVADSPEGADALIDAIGEDLGTFVGLIKDYNEVTQVGEA